MSLFVATVEKRYIPVDNDGDTLLVHSFVHVTTYCNRSYSILQSYG
jgi:hypothetical protein